MKTKIQLFAAFLLLAVGALWLTSCSSEDAVQGSGNTGSERVLLLSISTGQTIGSRAETDLTDDEKAIEDMTIGIFDANGNVRTIQSLEKDASAATATAGDGKFVISGTKAEAKIVTTGLKAGDKVVVAVNTKLNSANEATFKKAKSVADFNKGYIDATSALTAASDGTTLSAAKLPKYGTASLEKVNGSTSEFKVTVPVKNLVSRVTLNELKTEFASDGPYSGATFTLKEIFLLGVPNYVDFSDKGWTAQTVSYFDGADKDAAGNASTVRKAFLVKGDAQDGSQTPDQSKYAKEGDFLYTLPNEYKSNQKTILVLKGDFSYTKTGEQQPTTTTVYYPVALNAKYNYSGGNVESGTTEFQTTPGKNYKCNVTIKTIGSDSPWQEAGPLTATVDVEVEKWTDVEQNTYFK